MRKLCIVWLVRILLSYLLLRMRRFANTLVSWHGGPIIVDSAHPNIPIGLLNIRFVLRCLVAVRCVQLRRDHIVEYKVILGVTTYHHLLHTICL